MNLVIYSGECRYDSALVFSFFSPTIYRWDNQSSQYDQLLHRMKPMSCDSQNHEASIRRVYGCWSVRSLARSFTSLSKKTSSNYVFCCAKFEAYSKLGFISGFISSCHPGYRANTMSSSTICHFVFFIISHAFPIVLLLLLLCPNLPIPHLPHILLLEFLFSLNISCFVGCCNILPDICIRIKVITIEGR